MVQFNLLPDVKLEYLKAQRTKRMVMLAAFTATGLAVFIFILLFLIVNVFQKQHISNLNDDIQSRTSALQAIPDLDKVLTVQNQLNALTSLHEGKPATSKLYTYLVQLTPNDVKISDATIDFDQSTISINGSANSLESINRFVDILKFTDYKEAESTERAFTEVVLTNFGAAQTSAGSGRTSYSLNFKFKPLIFENTKTVELIVPNKISTRSVTEQPTDLFEARSQQQQTGGQN